jgi:hypothetical protein
MKVELSNDEIGYIKTLITRTEGNEEYFDYKDPVAGKHMRDFFKRKNERIIKALNGGVSNDRS